MKSMHDKDDYHANTVGELTQEEAEKFRFFRDQTVSNLTRTSELTDKEIIELKTNISTMSDVKGSITFVDSPEHFIKKIKDLHHHSEKSVCIKAIKQYENKDSHLRNMYSIFSAEKLREINLSELNIWDGRIDETINNSFKLSVSTNGDSFSDNLFKCQPLSFLGFSSWQTNHVLFYNFYNWLNETRKTNHYAPELKLLEDYVKVASLSFGFAAYQNQLDTITYICLKPVSITPDSGLDDNNKLSIEFRDGFIAKKQVN